MADVELRRFVAADLPALRALWTAVYGRPRGEAYDRWLLLTRPTWTSLAFAAGRCVGAHSLVPTQLSIGGRIVAGAHSLDALTLAEFRGQGLFVKLAIHGFRQAAAQGCALIFGFPNESSYPAFVRRLNFQHVGEVEHWTRPLGRAKGSRLGAFGGLVAPLLPLGPAAPELAVAPGRPPPGQLAALVAETMPTRDICRIHRSGEWFGHRYAPESGRTYEWMSARDAGGALTGTAAWRVSPRDGRSALLELVGTARARSHLLRTVLIAARDRGASRMAALGNDPDLVSSLKAAGFVKRRPLHFVVRNFSTATLPANPHWPPAWRLVTGDFDTV